MCLIQEDLLAFFSPHHKNFYHTQFLLYLQNHLCHNFLHKQNPTNSGNRAFTLDALSVCGASAATICPWTTCHSPCTWKFCPCASPGACSGLKRGKTLSGTACSSVAEYQRGSISYEIVSGLAGAPSGWSLWGSAGSCKASGQCGSWGVGIEFLFERSFSDKRRTGTGAHLQS